MVERYFAEQSTLRARPRRDAARTDPTTAERAATDTHSQQESPVLEPQASENEDTPYLDPARTPLPAPLKMERLQMDQIDWDLEDSQDWDTLVADADQTFLGMSFEEAKKRGLLDDLEAED
jgi:hypothetical protein